MNRLLPIFLVMIALFSCSKDKKTDIDTPTYKKEKITGVVEKGPFVEGSKVTLVDLDDQLKPTGKTYEAIVKDDFGTFEFVNLELSSPYVTLMAEGNYYNEITGTTSTTQINLSSFSNLQEQNTININVLTHLESGRIQRLMNEGGLDFTSASKQANAELLGSLGFNENEEADVLKTQASEVSFAAQENQASALLAVSSALLNTEIQGETHLADLLTEIGKQIEANGKLTDELKQQMQINAQRVDIGEVVRNLIGKYKTLGKDLQFSEKLTQYFNYLAYGPNSPISGEYLHNDEDIRAARLAIYNSYAEFTEQYLVFESLYAPYKNYQHLSISQQAILNHQLNAGNDLVYNMWVKGYAAIQRINQVYNGVKDLSLEEARRMRGEAPVLRSLLYYYMTELWGDVPYVLRTNLYHLTLPRNDVSEIRRASVKDLESQLSLLNDSEDETSFGKMKTLAQVSLLRWAMQEADYVKALQYAETIINSQDFKLAAQNNIYAMDNNESIAGYKINVGGSNIFQSQAFKNIAYKGDYLSYVRFTEVVLNGAEAAMQAGNMEVAQNYLNKVLSRNGVSQTEPNISENAFKELLITTYKNDLGGEGVYFSALKRLREAQDVLSIPAFRELLPIPQNEINVNSGLMQNPGY